MTLYIDCINTLVKCTDVTVTKIKDIDPTTTISSSNDAGSSVSIGSLLPSHGINLQVALTGTDTIEGLCVGLEGPGVAMRYDTLNALEFTQTVSVSGRLPTQQPLCKL
jgi:hypothetical protein